MVSSSYQQPSLASVVAPGPTGHGLERAPDRASFARGEYAEGRWYVRVVLAGDANTAVRSVRAIVDDRDTQRIVLHTIWTDWHDVPLLTTLLGTAPEPATPETMARDLAAALVASLRYDAGACLEQLGTPLGSLAPRPPGSQERAALRNVRDVAMREQQSERRGG